jgi:hypothetical protein
MSRPAKISTVGPESFRGEEALRFFIEPKNVCIAKQTLILAPARALARL